MIFGSKNKEGNTSVNLAYMDGIDNYIQNLAVQLSLDDKIGCLVIRGRIGKVPVIKLQYNKIVTAAIVNEKEIIDKNKSTVGRAVVGGVILGPLGAIIGGMSGIGNKQKKSLKSYLVINYNSENEVKALSFQIVGATLHFSSFMQKLRTKFKQPEIEKEINL